MTQLTVPDAALHRSWAAAMAELHPEGEHVNGSGLWLLPQPEQWDLTEAGCRRLVTALLERADPAYQHTDNSVPCHFLWITEDSPVADTPTLVAEQLIRMKNWVGRDPWALPSRSWWPHYPGRE